jgi:hypothetical protein
MFLGPQNQQAHTSPVTVRLRGLNHGLDGGTMLIEVGIGRDVTLTFRGQRLVMLEVNGLQYSPISLDQHADWFKALRKGGLDPIMKDAVVIEKMVMDYLFDAAIKTRMGES